MTADSHKQFTSQQRSQISTDLSKKLGPEYISYRQGWNNTRLMYVEGWLIICLANKIFDFDGWSSEIKNMNIDYEDCDSGKWFVGVSCIAKVTLKDGTTKEDVGFGSADNQRRKCDAYEKARKEAATDALKRALRQFGNALGNCCYDKEYLKDIQTVQKQKKDNLDIKKLLRKNDLMNDDKKEVMNKVDKDGGLKKNDNVENNKKGNENINKDGIKKVEKDYNEEKVEGRKDDKSNKIADTTRDSSDLEEYDMTLSDTKS